MSSNKLFRHFFIHRCRLKFCGRLRRGGHLDAARFLSVERPPAAAAPIDPAFSFESPLSQDARNVLVPFFAAPHYCFLATWLLVDFNESLLLGR